MHFSAPASDDLRHILWIGGAPDSGKTTIATLIAEKHGLLVYHFDRHEMAHFGRADSERTPALWAAHPDRMGPQERWLGSTPQEMARFTLASWSERFRLALEDLRALPAARAIIAEGPGFFPPLVAPYLADPRQAVWLVPDEAFKRRSVAEREKLRGVPVSDPARAVENLIQRDLLLADAVSSTARDRGLDVFVIDGNERIDVVTARIEARFAPWLGSGVAQEASPMPPGER